MKHKKRYFNIAGFFLAVVLLWFDISIWIPVTIAVLTWVISLFFDDGSGNDDDEYNSYLMDKLLKEYEK